IEGSLLPHFARGRGTAEMPGRGPGSHWTECSNSAKPPAVPGTGGGGSGSAGLYYQNSKGTASRPHHRPEALSVQHC
uniref:Family with sequence similarity 216 member A n=1 Tax=Marmota marmota marmota TaxID=9994 RepID=A0A8C5YP00_MARMA